MSRKLNIFFFIGVSLWVLSRASIVRASDDFQYWSGYEFSKSINPKTVIAYGPEFRIKDNASGLYRHEHRFGVRWDVASNWRLGANYLFARNEQSDGKWENENTGEFEVTPHIKEGDWDLSFRSRTELRYLENTKGEQWRFRLKPQIMYDFKSRWISFKPYLADEIFYDQKKDSWNENRGYCGAVFPIGNWGVASASANVYYMCLSKRSGAGAWDCNHVLGTKLEFKF